MLKEIFLIYMFFLVMDPRMIAELGGDLLFTKITRPHKAMSIGFGPTLFWDIDKGFLIICDNVLLEVLQYTVTRAVEDWTFHRCGVVLIINEEALSFDVLLTELNMQLRSLWASTSILLKLWNGGLARGKDGNFVTTAIGEIAARIDQGLKKLPALLRNPAVKLLCMHRSGRTVHNGPKAPVEPSMGLMTSTEVCTFVRAVSEAPTAQDAVALWNPGADPEAGNTAEAVTAAGAAATVVDVADLEEQAVDRPS